MSLFLDTARLEVKAGKGGDGAVVFAVKNMFQMVVLPVVTGEKAVL